MPLPKEPNDTAAAKFGSGDPPPNTEALGGAAWANGSTAGGMKEEGSVVTGEPKVNEDWLDAQFMAGTPKEGKTKG